MEFHIAKNVMVDMRDGVALATDVYRPAGEEPVPALLQRMPYGKERIVTVEEVSRFLGAGYAVVLQDARGRGESEGEFNPFFDEARDGEDTIAWLVEQPWCDGKVGMGGESYFGASQWLAAQSAPPGLKAIVPEVTSDNYYEGWTYQGGALSLGFVLYWTLAHLALPDITRRALNGLADMDEVQSLMRAAEDVSDLYRRQPLADMDVLSGIAPYYFEWLAHRQYDDFWRPVTPSERREDVVAASLNIGGWYDCFLGGTLASYVAMKTQGGSEEARSPRLIVGPWSHGLDGGEYAEQSFGIMANPLACDLLGEKVSFYDRHLKNGGAEAADDPPVKIFVMGSNAWRSEPDWPLPDTNFVDYYLHSGGHANTAAGDGSLSRESPASEPRDLFEYDPRDPVPTVGGQTLLPGLAIGANAGPRDQQGVEARHDVLCFTTDPLAEDLEVIGPVELVLFASSSALDTDFTGKLTDVHPDGRSMILTEGILRARYRNSTTAPELLEPDAVYELTIDLVATANVFRAGHRIRLDISSSNFPRFDRNTNTGGTISAESEGDCVIAANSVYHDRDRPSRLVLPVIERAG